MSQHIIIYFHRKLWYSHDIATASIVTKRNYALLSLWRLQFACCGINGSSNYGTSWWRLQEVGRRELVVPLSCCTLNNANETDSFLNPEPANLTFCQALNPAEHQYARHTVVCAIIRKLLLPLFFFPFAVRTHARRHFRFLLKIKRRDPHIPNRDKCVKYRISTYCR